MSASGPRRSLRRWSARAGAVATVMTSAVVVTAASALAAAPNPVAAQPPGTNGITTILGWGAWVVTALCVGGILLVAGMMALKHRRGEGAESMGALGTVLGACVLASAAGPLAAALLP